MEFGLDIPARLADMAIRSLILAAAGLAVIYLLRMRSAAARHAVWTAVTTGMLLLPALCALLPSMPLRILRSAPVVRPEAAVPYLRAAGLPGVTRNAPTAPAPARPFSWLQVVAAVYVAGLVACLSLLASSYRFTQRLVRASLPVELAGNVRESNWITVPVTVGFLSPKILLPAGWREWPAEKLAAVMTHERTHVRRADWAIAVLAGINRCVFWFHPLAWWLERHLANLAEQACDDAALLELGARESYAEALLDMAAAVKAGRGRMVWEVMAMAKTAEVRKRIDRILDETRQIPRGLTRSRWAALAACSLPLIYVAAVMQLAPAQTAAPPAFEVASVKLVTPDHPMMPAGHLKVNGATVDIGFMTLRDLIGQAYNVKYYQIQGPDWLNPAGQRFDILARLPGGATKDQVPEMLQALLAQRFKLSMHRAAKESQVYALVIAKSGLKMKESPPDLPVAPTGAGAAPADSGAENGPHPIGGPRGGVVKATNTPAGTTTTTMVGGVVHVTASKMPMPVLIDTLSRFMDHPVVDLTGLKGTYQIALDISPEDMRNSARAEGMVLPAGAGPVTDAAAEPTSSILTSVQMLGPKLELRKAPIEFIVIDRLEKLPTEN